jgi:hypothetical protein
MVSEVNAPGIGGGPASPKRCAETHTRGRLNAYRWPRMVGRDLRTRRSAQRLPHSADKDEAGGSSPPRPTAGPDQRKRWLNTGEGSSWCASRAACARNSGRGVLAHGPLSGEWPPRLPAPPALLGDPGRRCHGMPVTAGWICACGRGGHGRRRTCAGSRLLTLSVPSSCMVRVISLVRMSTARWTPRSPPAISP